MKKILFVCGSLEPGHDGVGDYTRSLAGFINSKGFDSRIISIMDRKVNDSVRELQESNGQIIQVLRISKNLSFKQRKKEYDMFLESFDPIWISLQYVPYAFSPYGIPLGLRKFLEVKNIHLKWYFMIHEAYISNRHTFKANVIQKFQISVLRMLTKKLKPVRVYTTIPSYQIQLKMIGIQSDILGLFGNIPIIDKPAVVKSNQTFSGVYFGAPPTQDNFKIFVESINEYLDNSEGNLTIVLCGQSGERGRAFASILREHVKSSRFIVEEKGRMSAEDLSKLFLNMDFGIARIGPQLLGKSGSAISLLEHGLPLWIPLAKSQIDLRENFHFRMNQCFVDLLELKESKQSFNPGSRLEEIAKSFMDKLSSIQDVIK